MRSVRFFIREAMRCAEPVRHGVASTVVVWRNEKVGWLDDARAIVTLLGHGRHLMVISKECALFRLVDVMLYCVSGWMVKVNVDKRLLVASGWYAVRL